MTTADSVEACIALGSNLGDRALMIRTALEHLGRTPGVEVMAVSSFIETPAWGDADQPPYLNAAAVLRSAIGPRAMLERLLQIERLCGRVRSAGRRWEPRTLDLDLLLFGQKVIDEPRLQVPHPEMHRRGFVLKPLAEVAGNVLHPVLQRTVADLLASLEECPECGGPPSCC